MGNVLVTGGTGLLRQAFGDVTDAAEVLERLAEAIRILEEDAADAAD